MPTKLWKVVGALATAAAGMLLVRCGNDPFAGTVYPAGAVAGVPDGELKASPEGGCSGQEYFETTCEFDDSIADCPCAGGPIFELCGSDGEYAAYTCQDPSSAGWTNQTPVVIPHFDGSVSLPSHDASSDANAESGDDEGGSFDSGTGSDTGGDDCTPVPTSCVAPEGSCSNSADCCQSGCGIGSGGVACISDVCWSICTTSSECEGVSTGCCVPFGSEYNVCGYNETSGCL